MPRAMALCGTQDHDGHNLAWKLALVLKGVADSAAAHYHETSAGRGEVHRGAGVHALRDAFGDISRRQGFSTTRQRLNHRACYIYRSPAFISGDDSSGGARIHVNRRASRLAWRRNRVD